MSKKNNEWQEIRKVITNGLATIDLPKGVYDVSWGVQSSITSASGWYSSDGLEALDRECEALRASFEEAPQTTLTEILKIPTFLEMEKQLLIVGVPNSVWYSIREEGRLTYISTVNDNAEDLAQKYMVKLTPLYKAIYGDSND